jgi:hypothetical protein
MKATRTQSAIAVAVQAPKSAPKILKFENQTVSIEQDAPVRCHKNFANFLERAQCCRLPKRA